MKKKKWFLWIIIILILGVVGFFGFNYWQSKSGTKVTQPSQAHLVDLKTTIEVQRGSLRKTVSASGYLQPVNSVNLNLESSESNSSGATVKEILIRKGEFVDEGQELVYLKNKQEQLNYLKAKNEYELAKINGSPSLIQEEKKLSMDLALEKLEAQTIRAPFSGKIVNIFVEEGDYIRTTDDVIYLIDEAAYEIEVSISEVDCLQLKKGQKVEIEFDAIENKIFPGKVAEVANFVEENSGVVGIAVTILMEEISEKFKPGFSALAEIIVDSVDNALIVPITSLLETSKGLVALKVNKGKTESILVKTGISDGFYREIIDGLAEGDRIVINQYSVENETITNQNKPGMGSAMRMMGSGNQKKEPKK